jgi:hypothetical protein
MLPADQLDDIIGKIKEFDIDAAMSQQETAEQV